MHQAYRYARLFPQENALLRVVVCDPHEPLAPPYLISFILPGHIGLVSQVPQSKSFGIMTRSPHVPESSKRCTQSSRCIPGSWSLIYRDQDGVLYDTTISYYYLVSNYFSGILGLALQKAVWYVQQYLSTIILPLTSNTCRSLVVSFSPCVICRHLEAWLQMVLLD